MELFLKKLDDLMHERGLNKHSLADQCGVPYTTIVGLYERGAENARLSTLNKICAFFGVPLDYLAIDTYEKPEDFTPQIPDLPGIIPIQTRRIPLLGDIACGTPCEPCQELDCYVTAGTDVRADFALRANGDSMIGARIHDGDIVFIRSQPTVDDGEIAAVMVDGETTLKRIRHVAGQLLLLPENPAYSPIIATAGQDVRILGKAIAFQSDVR